LLPWVFRQLFPIMNCRELSELGLKDGDFIRVNLLTGNIENLRNNKNIKTEPFSDVQYEVYQKGGLLG
jgi:hypothetical protein